MKKTSTKRDGVNIHPWRPCPLGKCWVSPHSRTRTSSKGNVYTQNVRGYCRTNPSHLDHLYKDDIEEVAERHFKQFDKTPLKSIKKFKGKDAKYDSMIQGWTKYWNDILKPADPLSPDVIKALIASESSFNPKAWNHQHGRKAAYGFMQVRDDSVQWLKDPKELRDHFVNLSDEDMYDPNLAICAGIRWLFRKKELAESKTKKPISWRDAVANFKGIKSSDPLMDAFDRYFKELKEDK